MKLQRLVWVLPAILIGCADYGAPDSVVSGVVVYTQPMSGFDFAADLPAGATYYLDTTMNVYGEGLTPDPVTMPAAVEDAIRSNLEALGYVPEIATPLVENADVGLKMSVLIADVDYYYPGYWCDYWYYYSCYYGGWYYAGSYTVGTVVLEMADLSAPPDGEVSILWTDLMYGVAYDYAGGTLVPASSANRIASATNRAFAQSQYLAVQPAP